MDSFYGKTKSSVLRKARTALKENGFTYNKSTRTWFKGGGFYNIEERTIHYFSGHEEYHIAHIVKA